MSSTGLKHDRPRLNFSDAMDFSENELDRLDGIDAIEVEEPVWRGDGRLAAFSSA